MAVRISGLTLLLLTVPAAAQTTTDPDPLAAYKPFQRITFPGNPSIESCAFSPDGEKLYVHLVDQAINIWEVLVYYWPEGLGGLTFLVVLVCGLRLRRTLQRPRLVGELHCRKCNYCLKGITRQRCPECGSDVHRPIIGRPMWRRTAPFALPLALVLVAYGSLWAFQLPRKGSAGKWMNWWSGDLLKWANQRSPALAAMSKSVDRIVEVEVETGRTLRTLFTRPAHKGSLPLTMTPDGTALLLPVKDGDRLALVSTGSGQVLRALPRPWAATTTQWRQIAGFDSGGRVVYLVAADDTQLRVSLWSWDVVTGESAELYAWGVLTTTIGFAKRVAEVPRFYCIPGSNPARLLEFPYSPRPLDAHLFDEEAPVDLRVRDAWSPLRVLNRFSANLDDFVPPGFGTDPGVVYLPSSALVGVDLETGQPISRLEEPNSLSLRSQLASVPQRNRIIISAYWSASSIRAMIDMFPRLPSVDVFLVADVSAGRWIGQYAQPDDWTCEGVRASPDGRFFAAYGSGWTRGGPDEVLIYDLTTLPHDLDFESH